MALLVTQAPKIDGEKTYDEFDPVSLFPAILVQALLVIASAIFDFSYFIGIVVGLSIAAVSIYAHYRLKYSLGTVLKFWWLPKYYSGDNKEPYESMTYYPGVPQKPIPWEEFFPEETSPAKAEKLLRKCREGLDLQEYLKKHPEYTRHTWDEK